MVKKPVGSLAAFGHRDFLLFWFAAIISNAAQWMQQFTIPVIVYELTESNTWVGLIVFAQLIPAFMFTPIAGVIADRISRVKVLRYTTTVQFTVAITFMSLWQIDALSPRLILILSLTQGVSAGLQIANWQSLVPQLVPPKHLFSAIRLNSAQFTASRALGPLIGAVLFQAFGAGAVFLTNAITYVVLISALMVMRPNQKLPEVPTKIATAFKEGITYVRERKYVLQAILTAFMISFLGQSLVQLAAGLTEEQYGGGPFGVAGFITANGVGTIVGSALLIKFGDTYSYSTAVKVGLILYTVGPLLIGVSDIYLLGLFGFFLGGIAHMAVGISLNTSIQAQLPDSIRGRVLSIYLMGVFAGIPLGALVGGGLGDVIGLQYVYIGYGVAFVIYLLLIIMFFNGHRLLNVGEESSD